MALQRLAAPLVADEQLPGTRWPDWTRATSREVDRAADPWWFVDDLWLAYVLWVQVAESR